VSHRRAPRPAANAFQAALQQVAPKTTLAAVQAVWAGAVGGQLARAAVPVSERDRTLTIECADAVWAQELDLMQERLIQRLREELGESAPTSLRFRVNSDRF
jgi:predicted nucleic acid-binding Zn ribbon protein